MRTISDWRPRFRLRSKDKPMTDHPPDRTSPIAGAFAALHDLAHYLRGKHGCPWDRAQGLESILTYLREETAELAEAVARNEPGEISEEWGDVVFILLMFAAIAEETGDFKTEQALRDIEAKMIRRHPHVFSNSSAGVVEEIIGQWEKIKAKEKAERPKSLMDNLPPFYSALKRADRVQRTAAEVGFDWPDFTGILEKIEEEAAELREALAAGNASDAGDELGDLLFSCVNLARFAGMDAESLLGGTIDKFIARFKYIESELRRAGKSADEATLGEMDELWERSKAQKDDDRPSQ